MACRFSIQLTISHSLKDTDKNQTRMFFAKGEKVSFFDRFCGFASDEYVNKEFDIIELYGKKVPLSYLMEVNIGIGYTPLKEKKDIHQVCFLQEDNNLAIPICM